MRWLKGVGVARLLLIATGILVLTVALWPELFVTHDPTAVDSDSILQSASWEHPLGTDEAGADVLARLVHATQLEVVIAAGSVIIALVIGVPSGLLAGNSGKLIDGGISSGASAILAFPMVLFAILVVSSFGTTALTLVGIIGFVFAPRVFVLVRAQTKALKEREFVVAARVTGISPRRTMARHVLPNMAGPLFTLIPQLMAEALLIEAGLSFLGLGVQLPDSTWGTILESSKDYYVTSPGYAVAAGLTITIAAGLLMASGELAAESFNPLKKRRQK
nr:ABC transporter permease [Garicola koreensis]